MPEAVAIWGAVTGTIGAGIAIRRELLSRRRRVAVRGGVYYNVSRKTNRVTQAWALVNFWNTGGRAVAVEHVGFRWLVPHEDHVHEWRGEITRDEPFELPIDSGSRIVHTPLGQLMKAGVDPWTPLQAFAITTGDQIWLGPPEPLVTPDHAMTMTAAELHEDLDRLAAAAERPPVVGNLFSLRQEAPFLPED